MPVPTKFFLTGHYLYWRFKLGFRNRIQIGSVFLETLDPDPSLIIQLEIKNQNTKKNAFLLFKGKNTNFLKKVFSFFSDLFKLLKKSIFFFYFFTFENQALDPDPYPDPHSFSKPWIRIRKKWMRIRNPGLNTTAICDKSFEFVTFF